MAYRKCLNFRSVLLIVFVILILFGLYHNYYFTSSTPTTETGLTTNKNDIFLSPASALGKYLPSVSTDRSNTSPNKGHSSGKLQPFIVIDRNDRTQSNAKNTENHLNPSNQAGRDDESQSQVNSTRKYIPSVLSGNASSSLKSPAKIDYRQRFLDSATDDLLHTKPPTYLPQFKNPCWYENSKENTNDPILRCLPYFMILGQNKCGTTDLYMNLIKHPDVIAAVGKEPQFWARIRHCYYNRPWTWNNYIDYFKPVAKRIQKVLKSEEKANRSTEVITGEATPSNLWDNRWWWNYKVNLNDTEPPAVTNADYIHHFMPNLKMIIILRNPVSRLYSDYKYVSKGKKSPEGFHREVVKEISWFRNCSSQHDFRYCVFRNSFDERNVTSTARLQNGFYAVFIEEYLKFYPREQFHIIRLEDYAKQKTEVMGGIFGFLKLRDPENPQKPAKRTSKKSKIGDMLPETKDMITEFYKPYTEHLADLLKDKRFLWLD